MSKRPRDDQLDYEESFAVTSDSSTPARKHAQVDSSDPDTSQPVIRCALAPHAEPLPFFNLEDYDIHYQKYHVNRCIECHKTLPSKHYLDLHIAENHDPIEASKRARGDKTYRCFVEGCDKICGTPQKRRMHLVDKHQFPRNFDFFIVNDGIDRRNSMLRPDPRHRRSSASWGSGSNRKSTNQSCRSQSTNEAQQTGDAASVAATEPSTSSHDSRVMTPETDGANEDQGMADLTKSLSAMRFIPRNVRFGRGGSKGFSRS